MKNIKITLIGAIILFISIYSCKKDEQNNDNSTFTFTELKAEKDTISPGETTVIIAIAEGENLNYLWSVTAGDIIGNGYKITYAPSPCTLGEIEVSCTVKNKENQSLSKTISIMVK